MESTKQKISWVAVITHITMFLFGALIVWGLSIRWGTVPPQSADWGNVADWATVIASAGALFMAVYNSQQVARKERRDAERDQEVKNKAIISRLKLINQELQYLGGKIDSYLSKVDVVTANMGVKKSLQRLLEVLPDNPLSMLDRYSAELQILDPDDEVKILKALMLWEQFGRPDIFKKMTSDMHHDDYQKLLNIVRRNLESIQGATRKAAITINDALGARGHAGIEINW